jgi:predicted amidohydrolase YtcJ
MAAPAPDWILVNANIYTMDARQPKAQALAIRGDRLAAIGSNEQVRALAGAGTRVVDASGRTVIPGLIDAHCHMLGLGQSLANLDLRAAASPEEVAELVRREAARRRPGEWIIGLGWDQNKYPGKQFPTHAPLTAAAPNNPVYLTRVDGHAAWVNRKAMELAGISAATADPPGGRLIREGAAAIGQPTGVLIDRAEGLVASKIPPLTPQQTREALERAAKECARFGLTGVHDAGAGGNVIEAYKQLIGEKRFPLRVYAMIGGIGATLDQYLKAGPEIDYGGARLTVRSIKILMDGALGSRGAAMLEPYFDEPGNRGLLMLSPSEFARVCDRALERGFQVNTHAIGDRANRLVLDIYEAALLGRKEFPRDHRFRIEHAQILAPEDIPRLARLGIIASMQATHATSDMPWAEARVGPQRVIGAYAWQSVLKTGARLANGSDFPVESPNPLWGFYAAITRQDHKGQPAGGWFPEQRMSREEALLSFTLEAAYAAFEERQKGSLEAGKLADFVVLSRDIMSIPPADILKTEVVRTVLGGETVYQAGK